MSKKPLSVLITGANGDIAEAMGRIVAEVWPKTELHGSDSSGLWPGLALFHKMHSLPKANDPHYLSSLTNLAKKEGYTIIIPATEPELHRLSMDDAQALGLPLLMNHPSVIAMGCDKLATYEWLSNRDIPVPNTQLLSRVSEADLPIIVKPRFGYGSRELEKIDTVIQLQDVQSRRGDESIAQEWLPPLQGEFTCALIKIAGQRKTVTLKRELLGGLTGKAEVVNEKKINIYLESILEVLPDPCAINIQLRWNKTEPLSFEINPRFSSTVMMRHILGFSDLKWMINYYLNKSPLPSWTPPVGTMVYRLSREVVVHSKGS
jgi:carbamoyl-phosphate synthase large subunit